MIPLNNKYNTDFFKQYGRSLADAASPEKRKTLQTAAAEQALESLTSQIAFDFNQFINLHLPLTAVNSVFEGNTIQASINFWKTFVETLCKGEAHFLPLDITPNQLEAVKDALKNIDDYSRIITSHQWNDPQAIPKLRDFVVDHLKSKKSVYVLHGYCGGPNNFGHAIPAFYELSSGQVLGHSFNQGDGSEGHPILDFTETGEIISYRFFPIGIPFSFFQNPVGCYLFYKDILLERRLPEAEDTPYGSVDVYGALEVIGKVHNLPFNTDPFRKKKQLGMTCADKAIKMVVNDVLIRHGVSHKIIKRFFCLARLNSIILGYHYWKVSRKETEDYQKTTVHFENALRAFSVAVCQRAQHVLSGEEVSFCKGIISTLLDICTKEQNKQHPPAQPTLISSIRCPTQFPPFKVLSVESSSSSATVIEKSFSSSQLPSIKIRNYDASLTVQLKAYVSAAQELKQNNEFLRLRNFIRHIFLNLESPDPNGSDAWRFVPLAEAAEVIQQIRNLVVLYTTNAGMMNGKNNNEESLIYLMQLTYKGYCIADRLARRCSECKLEGFYPQIWIEGKENLFGHINDGNNDRSLVMSCRYLASIKGANKKPLFYFASRIDMKEGVRSLKSDFDYHPSSTHLTYLNLFYETAWEKGLSKRYAKYSPESYAELWIDSQGVYLPREVHGLRDLALLASNSSHSLDVIGMRDLAQLASNSSHNIDVTGMNHLEPGNAIYTKESSTIICCGQFKDPFDTKRTLYDHLNVEQHQSNPLFDQLFSMLPESQNRGVLFKNEELRDIFLIRKERCLHFTSLLSWIRKRPGLFDLPKSRTIVEGLLLTEGILQEEVEKNPSIVSEFRCIFRECLERYRNRKEPLKGIIRMMIFAETHIKAVQKDAYDYSMGFYLQKILKELSQDEETLVLNGLVYAILPPLSLEMVSTFLQTAFMFTAKCTEKNTNNLWWLFREAHGHLQFRQEELAPLLNGSEKLQAISRAIIGGLIPPNTIIEGNFSGTYPRYILGQYEIDFSSYSIKMASGNQVGFVPINLLSSVISKEENVREHVTKRIGVWKSKTLWESLDGLYKVSINGNKSEIYKKFTTPVGVDWYRFVGYPGNYLCENDPLADLLEVISFAHDYENGHHFWHRESSPEKSEYIILCTRQEKIRFCVNQTPQGFIFVKTDEQGNPLPIQQVNLQKFKEECPNLFKALHCDVKVLRTRIFYNIEKGAIESVHYPNPGLDFYRDDFDGQSLLRCRQYSNYWLDLDARIDELGTYPYYFVLNSALQGRMVILLPVGFNSHRIGELPVNPERLIDVSIQTNHMSCFGVSEANGRLMSNCPTTNLHLTFLFAFLRNYKKALEYLPSCTQLQRYNHRSVYLINTYQKFKDESPEALAFYLKFAVLLIDHINQPQYNGHTTRKREVLDGNFNFNEFKQWVSDKLYRYFQVVGFRPIHRIPINMRLDEIETHVLLNNLRPEDQSNLQQLYSQISSDQIDTEKKFQWPLLNEMHYQVMNAPDRKFEGSMRSLNYPIYPAEMLVWSEHDLSNFISSMETVIIMRSPNPVVPFRYFVRFPFQHTIVYFFMIYEKIVASSSAEEFAECDLSLFYFARTIKKARHLQPRHLQPLLTVLNLVRRNAQKFKDLRFNFTWPSPEEVKEACLEIHARLSGLHANSEKMKGMFSSVKSAISFDAGLTSTLSLPPINKTEQISWEFPDHLQGPIKDALKPLLAFQPSKQLDKPQEPFIPGLNKNPKTKVEEYIWSLFAQGHDAAQKAAANSPTLKIGLSALKDQLEGRLKDEEFAAAQLKTEVEKKANRRPSDREGKIASKVLHQDEVYELKILGKQKLKLEVDTVLLESVLMKDLRIVRSANPTLPIKEIQEIIALTLHYYARCCTKNRIKQALRVIEKIKTAGAMSDDRKNELERLLFGDAEINPFEKPEILIYCYHTSRTLRPNQMKILKEIFKEALGGKDVSHLLVAFEAGGGKTDVLKIILKAIARRLGYIPVTISPKSLMYNDAEKERAALVNAYRQRAVYIEVELQTRLKLDNLIHIRAYLEKCQREKLHPMFTPETFYALALKYIVALYEKDVEAARHLSIICFHLFGEKMFAFIDESRLTLGPETHAMIGLGKPIPLPREEQRLFLKLYRELLGCTKNPIKIWNHSVAEILRIQSDKQGEVSKQDVDEIKGLIADRFANDPDMGIPETHHASVKEFWLNDKNPEPAWMTRLSSENPKIYQLNVVLREFFNRILPFAFGQAHRRDYDQDETQSVEYDVPKDRKTDTQAFFKNPYQTIAITIQGTFQRGLTNSQIIKMICRMVESCKSELISGYSEENAPTLIRWRSWANGQLPPLLKLESSVGNGEIFLSYDEKLEVLRNDSEAIFWYLEEVILPQVMYSPLSVSVNPCHLFHGFAKVMATSAYPGPHDLYPFRPSQNRTSAHIDDNIFPAKVIQELCDPRNSQMISVDFDTIDEFFESVYREDPQIFTDLCTIGDTYGMLRKFNNIDVARAFLKFARKLHEEKKYPKIDGVIFFNEGKNIENKKHHFFLRDPNGEPDSLQGSDVVEALWTELGLRWEKLNIVTYYDIEHNTGEHVRQPEKGTFLFLLAEKTPISQGVQTYLRDRNAFLKTKRIVWCNTKRLEAAIAQEIGKRPTSVEKSAWMVRNEASLTADEILTRSYRQIAYLIQAPAYHELYEVLHSPEKQIERFHKNPQRFLEENFKNRYQEFGQSVAPEKTAIVLWDYAKALYQKHNYSAAWSEKLPLYQEIKLIIERTSQLIAEIPRRNIAGAGERAHIHIHEVQQVQQHQNQQVVIDLKPVNEVALANSVHIFAQDFSKHLIRMGRPVRELFKSPSLSAELYYTDNAIQTALSAGRPLAEGFLKPVEDILLIQEEGGPLRGFALSKMEAAHFKQQLDQGLPWLESHNQYMPKSLPKQKVMLVTSTAIMVQNGSSGMSFDWEELRKTASFQDLVSDVALLQGRICFQERLSERLRTWEDIWVLWDKVIANAALPETIHRSVIEALFPQAFRRAPQANRPAKPAWSLYSIFKV